MINEKNALFGYRYNNPNFDQNKSIDHPANVFARNCGASNWDSLLEKMKKGFVAVGTATFLPSKSNIGMTLFLNVINSIDSLILVSDDIGHMVLGFREHLPADLLAEHDARVQKQKERMLGWLGAIKKASEDPSVPKIMVDSYPQFERQSEAAHAFECEQPSENAEVIHDAAYYERAGFYSSTTHGSIRMKSPQVHSIPRVLINGQLAATSGGGRSEANPTADKTASNPLLRNLLKRLK